MVNYSSANKILGVKQGKGKRSLGTRDRQILYHNAKKKCENCGKKLEYSEMQAGHKRQAASKGGKATPSNSVCLCYRCNKLQGTDSWATFRKKQGKTNTRTATSGKKRKATKKKAKKARKPSDPMAALRAIR